MTPLSDMLADLDLEDYEYSDLELPFGSTRVTYGALAEIGAELLNLVAAARMLRHASPAGSVEYAEAETGAQMIVRDFALWCSAPTAEVAAGERLIAYLNRSHWADMVLRSAGHGDGAA